VISRVLAASGRRGPLVSTVVAVTALALGACGGGDHGHESSSATVPGARTIEVGAKSFEFKPKDITVKSGEPVTISLKSEDIIHDFTVDEFKVHVSATPDKPGQGGLQADKPGRYEIYCSVSGHKQSGMTGTLIVE
jgi:heme/copper-type cytochrome/quinol oxidase subunit 2